MNKRVVEALQTQGLPESTQSSPVSTKFVRLLSQEEFYQSQLGGLLVSKVLSEQKMKDFFTKFCPHKAP